MAKTIPNLAALNETPNDSDLLVIDDSGITKKITAGNLKGDCIRTVSDVVAIPDADNISFGTVTGSKIGTATSQKIGFWNATPVDQPAVNVDLLDSLQEVGLIASNAGDTPLNLSAGTFACGTVTCTGLTVNGNTTLNASITIEDGDNIAVGTVTGTKIGTGADQRIGLFNATPVVQPSATGETVGFIAGSGTTVREDSTFTGNVGNRAYRISDIVKALKQVGILQVNNP
jgi:hypothetical protein